MEAGYSGETPEPAAPAEDKSTEAAPAAVAQKPEDAKPADKPATGDDDILTKVTNLIDGRLRNHTGHVSKLLEDKLKSFTPTTVAAATAAAKDAGADAPTKAQVAEAMQSSAKMKELETEFPEFAAAMKEQAAAIEQSILSKVPKAEKVDTTKFATKDDIASIRQATIDDAVDARDPEWTNKINTPEFAAWFANQSPEVKALGASDKLKDGFKFMDLYAAHEKTVAKPTPKATTTASNKQRLQESAVVTPTGGKVAAKVMTPEDAMMAGYKAAG